MTSAQTAQVYAAIANRVIQGSDVRVGLSQLVEINVDGSLIITGGAQRIESRVNMNAVNQGFVNHQEELVSQLLALALNEFDNERDIRQYLNVALNIQQSLSEQCLVNLNASQVLELGTLNGQVVLSNFNQSMLADVYSQCFQEAALPKTVADQQGSLTPMIYVIGGLALIMIASPWVLPLLPTWLSFFLGALFLAGGLTLYFWPRERPLRLYPFSVPEGGTILGPGGEAECVADQACQGFSQGNLYSVRPDRVAEDMIQVPNFYISTEQPEDGRSGDVWLEPTEFLIRIYSLQRGWDVQGRPLVEEPPVGDIQLGGPSEGLWIEFRNPNWIILYEAEEELGRLRGPGYQIRASQSSVGYVDPPQALSWESLSLIILLLGLTLICFIFGLFRLRK